MSASDLEALLNAPKLFLFLPVVNYVYLIGTTNPSGAFLLGVIGAFVSAFVYNTLDGIPAQEAKSVRLTLTFVFMVSGLLWSYLLYDSARSLLQSFDVSGIGHEVLFFTSLVFAAIVSTHILLLLFVDEYNNKV